MEYPTFMQLRRRCEIRLELVSTGAVVRAYLAFDKKILNPTGMGVATFKFPTVSNTWKKIFSVSVAKIVPLQAVKTYGEGVAAPLILNIATGWKVTCAYVCVCIYIYIWFICIYA
jgi:hypothetical protein